MTDNSVEFIFEVDQHNEFIFPFVFNSWFAYQQMKWLERDENYLSLRVTSNDLYDQFPDKEKVPIGSIQFVHKFMDHLGVTPPNPLNIPQSVAYLTDYGYVEKQVKDITSSDLPCFIKPKKLKLFDGGVMETFDLLNNLMAHNVITENTEVLLREPFLEEIQTEYRIPVFDGKPFAAQPYNGIYSPYLDWSFVQDLCKAFEWKRCPYVIDVGVGDHGTNYLIEFTHFYSVSLYGVEDVKLIKSQLRWWMLNVWPEL